MLARLLSYTLYGIDARPVEVEVDISPGALPKTILVGLAEAAVRECTHRIERAIVNSGYVRCVDRIVINLSPADLPKEAASLDLPIALGILAASGQLDQEKFNEYAAVGELALDGSLRPARGTLSMAMEARQNGQRGLLLPAENAREASVVEGVDVIPVGSLVEAVGFLNGLLPIEAEPGRWQEAVEEHGSYPVDYSDVKGQEFAKRALTVAAAGNHHLLMLGPPGSGKTLLASRIATILPSLSQDESLETTRVHSATGLLSNGQSLIIRRPFREPHHTVSEAGLVGGGSIPKPGEISLAHNGVLFLDELPEFNKRTLEVLRQPLESQNVTITRAIGSTTFPADFMLIAAMNPSPSGYGPESGHRVNAQQMERYLSKVSGPLLDRIDIHIEVPAVPFRELADKKEGTNSATMKEQVMRARAIQATRFANQQNRVNGRMTTRQIRQHCRLTDDAELFLKAAMEDMGLSARAHDRILRVSRTIADLDGEELISEMHLSEAVNYRSLDRKYWS
ncbi:YifB family Mg chelatase-like AAA ATPase [Rubinisphaera brasiliensis]|uniref:Mg chelatase, subunit ChlI n=1 Tax=Rubinisphaera brasiliensis (strain ATCC 49424 / DSM 5305 / JCM 21570 / IAM 15109 / NBRC 103401 / IFAM 1448) TaxID=756272 RepID=F0SFR4_RUBBR|nr:YifB family Mg chelatase-like AAA ATPase [Rubinisphaera brasiliensis]ADY61521.1 Mg chelatase, subunit ChlI [Rubinisphaera brasiliensis DSM 5305]